MPRTCTVCRHPEREHIDAALVSGRCTFRQLAAAYYLSPSAVRRHRTDHLPEVLTKAKSLDDIVAANSLAEQVRTLRVRVLRIIAKAEADGDAKTELAAVRELRALAELEARGVGRDGTVIHVSIVQQYVQKVIEVIREFVPPDRLDVVIAKLEAPIPADGSEPSPQDTSNAGSSN